jgi:signal transduction histidine kinase
MKLDNNVQVSVADQGMGIDEEDQAKLFDRFYRAKSNPTGISGFGIGLYLCREIISRLDGKIWVQSEPGKQSVFYFTVPLAS